MLTTLPATGVQHAAWLLLAFPAFAATVLLLGGRRTDRWGHLLGVAAPLAAFGYGLACFFALLSYPVAERSRDVHMYSWIPVGRFQVSLGLLLDPLSMCFVLLITGVGSLIIIYSVGYMAHDRDRRRFFGYMNLFITAMLLLVLADNYLVLYAGWEGVGLASYLLIGFWQFKPSAAVAAKKAFIANRVGDAGFSLAVMLMFATFGTVTFSGVFSRAHLAGPGVLAALGLLMLLGACGKSAQVPLQSWLLDAMEGPTPVSALIHAATMVTAGVYLIVRSSPIFDLSETARLAVTVVGAVTLLFGGIIGSAKDDIKKALAGSTMSQIGYMFLAAGLGPAGYGFAIGLLLAHGFFKAGLFLGAGSIMHGMNDEVNMRRFGGLARLMPVTFVTFGLGYLAIIGVPPFSGFFTKDPIIDTAFSKGGTSGALLGTAALIGAGITAFYMTRVMLMTFTGKPRWKRGRRRDRARARDGPASARIAGRDDLADDRAGDRLGRSGRVPHHQRAAHRLPGPGHRRAAQAARDIHPGRVGRARAAGRGRRDRLGDVRAPGGPGGRPGGPVPRGRGAQGPVRRRVQRVGADAAGPVADQAVGVLRQPRRGRPGEHRRGHRGRHVGTDAQAADRLRPLLRARDVLRRGPARRRPAPGEAVDHV